jgi:hypothetical protein
MLSLFSPMVFAHTILLYSFFGVLLLGICPRGFVPRLLLSVLDCCAAAAALQYMLLQHKVHGTCAVVGAVCFQLSCNA